MSDQFNDYHVGTANWRETLRRNNFRTRIVILLFILIYCSIGMLVDMYMSTLYYPHATIPQLFEALITFKIFPLATLIMLIIAGISLMVTYAFYDKLMLLGTEYHEITPTTAQNLSEQQLYNIVEEMQIAAGLRYMPRVFIIDADYMNAFASGYSEKSAMIAITRGLMGKLNRDELQAVMAHELSHIRHLDIKLTLTASLLANLSVMVLDMVFYSMIFSSRSNSNNSRSGNKLAAIIMIFRYLLPIISLLLLLYLSRTRELMADAGAVELMRTNQPLASALMKISDDHAKNRDQYTAAYQQTPHENVRRESYIYDPTQAGIAFLSLTNIFSTHPGLEARLAALGIRRR